MVDIIDELHDIQDEKAKLLIGTLRANEVRCRRSSQRHFQQAAARTTKGDIYGSIHSMVHGANRDGGAVAYAEAIMQAIKIFSDAGEKNEAGKSEETPDLESRGDTSAGADKRDGQDGLCQKSQSTDDVSHSPPLDSREE